MPRTSLLVEEAGGSARGGVGGTPAGCAGWRRRSGRGADVLRAPRARGEATARLDEEDDGEEDDGEADDPLLVVAPPFSVLRGEGDVDRCGVVGVARLSLRRCGRLRGNAPRTSEGRSSLNGQQSWRKAPLGARASAVLAKSEQDLKPPSRLRVYLYLGGVATPLAIFDFKKYSD